MKQFIMKICTTLSLIVLAVVFTNCNETKKVMESTSSDQLMGTYNVTELNGVKIDKAKDISFEISELDKSIRGTTGCNSFFGTMTKEGDGFRVTEMNISENYCDEDIMKTEQNLMSVFNTAASYVLKEQLLTVYSDNSVILNAVKDTDQ